MQKAKTLSFILIVILLVTSFSLLLASQQMQSKEQVYVGVAFGGTTVEQAKTLINRVKTYTNLFVLASGLNPISSNQTAVVEICDYATNAGLNIIVNLGTRTTLEDWAWKLEFYKTASDRYGEKYLGTYYDDEPGGIPLDWDWEDYFTRNDSILFSGANPLDLTPVHYLIQLAEITGIKPQNYSIEAEWFHKLLTGNRGFNDLKRNNLTTFTSDYVLFWFDYLGGYDTLFAQLGHNSTSTDEYDNDLTSLALLRGAATMQKKDWGAIVTWKYNHPPYLDEGQAVYNQMKKAYNAGAKYIMVFDFPYNVTKPDGTLNPYGVLTEKHFQALRAFWNNDLTKPPTNAHAEAALVLPKDYGWGLRNPEDRIWGFWGPDEKSPLIWNNTQILLRKFGLGLDIIYEDPDFPIQGNYSRIYYWNQTVT